jgi:hypothetical protein
LACHDTLRNLGYILFMLNYNPHGSFWGKTMPHLRVYEEADRAIQEHKWIASEKAGRDLGVEAKRDWIEHHWHAFYRSRLVEHLCGETFFDEFDVECFGIFSGPLEEVADLLDLVLRRIREGAENLDLLRWGCQEHVPYKQLLQVLIAANLNGHRLLPPHT